jgi:predicted PurR-regulated permease PerM
VYLNIISFLSLFLFFFNLIDFAREVDNLIKFNYNSLISSFNSSNSNLNIDKKKTPQTAKKDKNLLTINLSSSSSSSANPISNTNTNISSSSLNFNCNNYYTNYQPFLNFIIDSIISCLFSVYFFLNEKSSNQMNKFFLLI